MVAYDNPQEAVNPLTRLLLTAVPPDKEGMHTITHLADLMGMSRQGIHKWTKQGWLPPERVMQIVEISKIEKIRKNGSWVKGEPRVSREDFHDFVYKAP